MGEAYKGLTIRIGADTTQLQSALRNTNSALSSTQSLLRTIEKGLKFDPGNVDLLKSKMTMLSERLDNTAMKARDLKTSYKDSMSVATDAVKKWVNYQGNLSNALARNKDELASVKERLAALNDEAKAYASMYDVTLKKGETLKALETMEKLSRVTAEDKARIVELHRSIEGLDKTFLRLDANVKDMGIASELRKIKIQEEALSAETKDLAAKFTLLEATMDFEKANSGVRKTKEYTAMLTSAIERLDAEARQLDDALSTSPKSFSLILARAETAKEKLDALNQKAKSLGKQIQAYVEAGIERSNASMVELVSEFDKASQRSRDIALQLTNVRAEITAAERDAEELSQALDEGAISEEEMRIESARLKSVIAELNKKAEVFARLLKTANNNLKTKEAQLAFRELEIQLKATTAAAESFNAASGSTRAKWEAIRDLATTFGATLTPLLMTGAYKVVAAADEIDSAYRNMRKTVQGTEEEFVALKDAALEFANTHAVSAEDILNIEAMGGQLGLAVDKLQAFAEVASNLDIATDMDSDTIAEQLGQLNNILDWGAGDMERYGDALVRLGNNMPAQESHISQITTRIASMSAIVGMSTDEILAWATAAAATGQGAEAAGTALSNTMSKIETAVSSGGDTLQKFADVAQTTGEKFAKTWNDDPSSALQMFINGLKEIDDKGGSVDSTLISLGITATRQKQLLQSLTTTTDVLSDSLIISRDAWNGVDDAWGQAGDASREAMQKSEGFSGALQILKNNASALAASIGDTLLPVLELFTKFISKTTDVFNSMPPAMQKVSIGLAAFFGIIGPIARVFSQFGSTMSALNDSAKKQGEVYSSLGKKIERAAANTDTFSYKVYKAADASDTATNKLGKLKTKMAQTAMTSQSFATALSVLKTMGIMAAASAALILISRCVELVRQQREVNASFKAFDSSALESLDAAPGVIDNVAVSVKNLSKVVKTNAEDIASLKESFSETEYSLLGSKKALDKYMEIIEGAKSPTDDVEQAIKYVNSTLGTNIEVFDEAGNKISGATESLRENADAWIENAKAQAYANMITQEYEELAAIEQQIIATKDALEEYKKKYDAAMERGDTQQAIWIQDQMGKLETTLGKLRKQYEGVTGSIENLESAASSAEESVGDTTGLIEDRLSSIAALKVAIDDSGSSVEWFAKKLSDMGISFTDLTGVTESEWNYIVSAIESGEVDISGALLLIQKAVDNIDYGNIEDGAVKATESVSGVFEAFLSTVYTSGEHIAENLTGGLTSTYSEGLFKEAGMTVGEWLADYIKHSVPKKGPLKDEMVWPIHMAQNWYAGTKKAQPIYAKASLMTARTIAGEIPDISTAQSAAIYGSSYLASSNVHNTYIVNGITYDDGSNISSAVQDLIRAARIQRRS